MDSGNTGGFFSVKMLQNAAKFFLYIALLCVAIFLFLYVSSLTGAAGGQINPDAAGNTSQGTRTSCGTAVNYDCVNDGVSSTSIPSTSGDYLTFSRNQSDSYQLSTLTGVGTATAVQIFIYHAENANYGFQISLWDAAETTQYGTTQSVTTRTLSQWDSVTISGLTLSQAQLDALRVRTTCVRTGTGNATCTSYAVYAYITYDPAINVQVSAGTSTMKNLDVGTTTAYVGGSFVIQEQTSSRNITSITVAEGGTVNAATNLDNIKLMFDYDTTTPYNCASESYDGNELQYGSTDTDGFSAANGTSVFSSSTVSISTTQALCIYPVLDVVSTAASAETMHLRITDASTDVVGSGSAIVRPQGIVTLSGTTTLQKQDLRQMHYHWRNDDGTESSASSATGGVEDTPLAAIQQNQRKRVRIEVSNEGNKTSASTSFRIEYAAKSGSCSASTGWTDIGAVGGEWDMSDSLTLTDGTDTTSSVAVSSGGLTDENTTFLTPNAAVKDTSSQVTATTLTSTQFIEMEFSIAPTVNATEGATYCFRVTNAGTEINNYNTYPEATIQADLTVTATSTQTASVLASSTNVYAGGGFAITDGTAGAHTISAITLYASGTVDYQNKIKNLKLLYDLDTSSPYNCVSESYSGSELQFGATNTVAFSATATSTFNGSVIASTTQAVCLYVVYSVASTTPNGGTLDIYMNSPSTDIVVNTGSVAPSTQVAINGITTFIKTDVQQIHYHWRTNDGTETTATSATNGTQDTALTKVTQGLVQRLRFAVSNEGGTSTTAFQYRIEFAQKTSSCAAATGWTNVGDTGGAWDMITSQLVEGSDTTNIATTSGGVGDENASFLTPNGGQRETTSQTGNITLSPSQWVELEYSISATASSSEGATYCFRLTNAGIALDTYVRYPEASIKDPTDFLVQRGVSTMTGTTLTITAGTDYVAPASSTRAFIRITNTHHTGAGDSGATGNQNANSVTAYISNPSNIGTSITFTRTSATTDTRIAWEIVEYIGDVGGDNEIVVRSQSTITYGATALGATTTAIAGIENDNDVVVFITGQFNPNAGRADYNTGLSTSKWNAAADTATFDRGEANSNAVIVSYAVVEFVGQNWAIQRTADHAYTNPGATEPETITSVGSLTRTFLHAQKRVGAGLDAHEDFGHEVWLSGLNQVSFRLDVGANTVSQHVSVAWVIENTQTIGDRMVVTQSNYPQSGGAAPATENKDINATLDDLSVSSIFINNSGSGTGTSWPEPMIAARLISTTQYEIWVSNTGDSRAYRTEVVEWPTAARKITQNAYMFFVNDNLLDPADPWPLGGTDLGENTEVTGLDDPIASGESMRIRMSLRISSAALLPGVDTFKLQYGERLTTCSAIPESSWFNIGNIGSTTALWRATSTPLTDGTALSSDPYIAGDLNLADSDVAGTFEEENFTAPPPYRVEPGQDVEYDWAIQNNGATDKTSYCFRMAESDGTLFLAYSNYPTMRTVGYGPQSQDWRWYDDAQNETPTTTLAATNTAPIEIDYDNSITLRWTLKEVNGAPGSNAKFRLQFSEYSSFATSTFVDEIGSCTNFSYWCYTNGGGVDNATITTKTLGDADACVAGLGNGCGTHNESGTTTSTFVHKTNAATEFSFTIRHSGARQNRTYYFRAYDVTNDEVVPLGSGEQYPSLTTKGATLSFSVLGVATGTVTEGITTDVATTPKGVSFGSILINTDYEAVQQIQVTTNATQGYQVFLYSDADLTTSFGAKIDPITGTNASPLAWSVACSESAAGCFGYHAGDDTLYGGSARFSASDTYARVSSTTPEEVVYSSASSIQETTDVVYKLRARQLQEAGIYEASLRYIVTPHF